MCSVLTSVTTLFSTNEQRNNNVSREGFFCLALDFIECMNESDFLGQNGINANRNWCASRERIELSREDICNLSGKREER